VITGAPSTIQGELPEDLQASVAERAEETARENVAQRVWGHDPSLWGGPGVPEIENRLGWLTVSDAMLEQTPELRAFAAEVRADGFTDAVLLGMGGSSLGPEVLRRSFGDSPEGLRLQVLDSTHPDVIKAVQESVDLEKTLFIVSSKSGGTVETLSHYRHFKSLAKPNQFVVVTDPGSPLEQIAEDDGLRRAFLNTPDIGGRYSVLSYFGLVPAALMGVNVEALLHSAQEAERNCREGSPESNAALWLGAAIGEMARHGRDKLTFLVSGRIESFGLWAEQLVAESTGKKGRGILPVADEPLGEADVYGTDRVFAYLRNADEADGRLDAAIEQLAAAGHPTMTLDTHGPVDLGRVFFLAEYAVAVAGWVLEINPFDQPNVQEAKDKTKAVLDSGSIPTIEPADDEQLRALLGDANPPHYVAIMGYLPPSGELDAAIAELRSTIRAATGAAVTFGYGPRFQHSTGQLHKGGPPTGRFLQLVNDPETDVEIPGESYTFATLIAAQSAGDLQTLRDHGLAAARVKLDGDPAEAVRALTTRIAGLLV
jgi:glucose-6-phosphate isomerase